ncbi:MAG TPA: low affinity iron permease family protein [Chryseosolibacter sp.]
MTTTKNKKGVSRVFDRIATRVTQFAGRPAAFIIASFLVIIWAITGPLFDFSTTWQLVINTGTTIITFLMVFIIQQTQNKDTLALQLKLNELIACNEKASNRLIEIEDLTEQELIVLKKFYIKLSTLAENENDLYSSHSIDEANVFHQQKRKKRKDSGIIKGG